MLATLASLAAGWATESLAQAPRPSLTAPLTSKNSGTTVLPVDQAFQFSVITDTNHNALLSWSMRPGYYLYREKLEVQASDGRRLALTLPPTKIITDEFEGESQVYFDSLQLVLPLQDVPKSPQGSVILQVIYQGCAQDRYCYPPVSRKITLNSAK